MREKKLIMTKTRYECQIESNKNQLTEKLNKINDRVIFY